MNDKTQHFSFEESMDKKVKEILSEVYSALKEKGYNPIAQLVGYLISGDPTYITNHKNARSIIRRIERDEILEEIVKFYIDNNIE
ncbi:uncharacterized protein (UPF0297 family) [Caldicellulosiruptor bescii]|jgi:uncharacterized protein (UPF0297 family)|uniref:UPF0297 protein Athe_1208 n=2 Tax=Caldicellulosiruptor bescii TaxID=31899 RepID=B9MRK4_CALBD|nr:IreB family regulatory phosphoprotein [Caldicellulosiruptor bescii]ACM60308.1 protein of unknown function DUF965 [Caldicellulosiruptor bescii DSM 6725]PBC87722.1 uncharacterized protein (UPF0297 family) [Caldicellulosiruptor bescii]PBC90655.1 uncharacterized protein (UPF0297 family) [Caldicellulosiruptor bescii]PBD03913.1 uncharacterized protein (UPF0297 family) [Caldicellulosiruptor bescii]PBD06452.1 uncharacterized protein (UPF0297 family) [Caldicellulosiruptor bescii]